MPVTVTPRHIAVIGGGWAGLTAAVTLTLRGHRVSLWEASRHWGGRARALDIPGPQGERCTVDNGQHILIGAYRACLQLMQTVGIDATQQLQRLPLDLRDMHGQGLQLPDLPPPWNALLGITRARGWSWRDKLQLLLRAQRWQRQGFRCGQHQSVAELCAGLPERLMQDFIEPLCVSALNLPAAQASGSIFLRVLQDGMFSGRGSSDTLIPRTHLGALLPDAAVQWLLAHGAQLRGGQRVQHLQAPAGHAMRWHVNDQPCDGVVLACSSNEAARLVLALSAHAGPHQMPCEQWAAGADALAYTAIGTVYACSMQRRSDGRLLPAPMVALRSGHDAPAQFAFDRSQPDSAAGLIALVASDCRCDRQTLQAQAMAQARAQLQLHDLQPLQTVIDKRASFACTPGVQRPAPFVMPGLWACGDYVEGPYPATLEGAVRSALELAAAFD